MKRGVLVGIAGAVALVTAGCRPLDPDVLAEIDGDQLTTSSVTALLGDPQVSDFLQRLDPSIGASAPAKDATSLDGASVRVLVERLVAAKATLAWLDSRGSDLEGARSEATSQLAQTEIDDAAANDWLVELVSSQLALGSFLESEIGADPEALAAIAPDAAADLKCFAGLAVEQSVADSLDDAIDAADGDYAAAAQALSSSGAAAQSLGDVANPACPQGDISDDPIGALLLELAEGDTVARDVEIENPRVDPETGAAMEDENGNPVVDSIPAYVVATRLTSEQVFAAFATSQQVQGPILSSIERTIIADADVDVWVDSRVGTLAEGELTPSGA